MIGVDLGIAAFGRLLALLTSRRGSWKGPAPRSAFRIRAGKPPMNGARERARRRRQIAEGRLTAANGVVFEKRNPT